MAIHEPSTTILLPAYNEEEGLVITLKKLFQVIDNENYEVIVIDDGSTDRTSEVATQFPCRIIKHEINKGKGEAIKTGIKNARSENIICIDADDTYPTDIVPQIAHYLQQYDVVIGSRFYGRRNIPLFNRIGNFIIRILIKYIYKYKPFDPLTGLWGIKKQCAEQILPTARFAPDAEMQIKAARIKLQMYDIKINYNPRVGDTKLPSIKGGYEHFKLIASLLWWHPK